MMFKVVLESPASNCEVASAVVGTVLLLENTRVMLANTDPLLQGQRSQLFLKSNKDIISTKCQEVTSI